MNKYKLTLLPDLLVICRLHNDFTLSELPRQESGFYSVTRTADEVSLVCREESIPAGFPLEKDFRLIKVEGPLDFSLTGVLASLLKPLADAAIPVFTISTYDTDYILVRDSQLEEALRALSSVAVVNRLI
jgi:uncharacterized protein